MLEIIREYIADHIKDWATPPQISCPALWKPLFRTNLNYNFVEEYPLITRIIFWMDGESPRLITKIVDKSLSRESIDDCQAYQQNLNKQLGYDLFPPLYDIADINGCCVLFEPAMQESTYEMELKGAVYSPEATHPYVGRVITRQFTEMGKVFSDLLKITSSEPKQWGQTFYDLGDKLKALLGGDILSSEHLDIMRRNIDSVPIYDSPVIADLACQNIFPGPQLIDNIIPDIKGLNEALPGVINAFRFMVPVFYSPPLSHVAKNGWTHALASALMDGEEETVLAKPVRNLCHTIGLDPNDSTVIWAFIMGATFFEMVNMLDFYKNISSINIEAQCINWIEALVAVQKALEERSN